MEHNITAADGPVRSPRKRTAVPTYNLKVLNGTSRHARKDYRQKQRMSEPRVMASMEQNSDNVVISGLPTNIRRSTTGSLTSPMESPQLNALEISLRDVDATPLDGHAANTLHGAQQIGRSRDSMMPRQDAANFFNIHSSPRGHYYSAPVLYACGVWVGYLAPDKQNKSYKGLPSYNELKANWKSLSLPYPSPPSGSLTIHHEAVCQGCLDEESAFLTLRTIPFAGKLSAVIMPLDGEDEMGMFCILLPQALDRSIKSVQIWRPYEVRNAGDGKIFDNDFKVLTLRDTTGMKGTVETILDVVGPQDPLRRIIPTISPVSQAPSPHKDRTRKEVEPRPPKVRKRRPTTSSNVDAQRTTSRLQRRLSAGPERTPQVPQLSLGPSSRSGTRTSQPAQNGARSDNAIAQLHTLTESQAQRVHIVWPVGEDEDGYNYELTHTMAECASFSALLDALNNSDEARHLPAALSSLATTNLWRLSYETPDGKRIAMLAKRGSEVVFVRLRAALAQPSLWVGKETLMVELKPCS